MSMQSRRDLYQAHRLMSQRAALALLRGEPDVPDQPLRRMNIAAFSGVLVAVIVAALFAVLALLGHGSSSELRPGTDTLVIDQQTGTSYVFCEKNKLCPALNYASARLALASSTTTVNQEVVSQSALANYAAGPMIGIAGLPQPLPSASLLIKQPWSVCEQQLPGQPAVSKLIGGTSVGGNALGNGDAVLVKSQGQDWVVSAGERFQVQPALLVALNTSAQQAVSVPAIWLNGLPRGPNFAPPAIPFAGKKLVASPDGKVPIGQVFQVSSGTGGPQQYYVMLDNGLAKVTETQATLLDDRPGAPSPKPLPLSDVVSRLSRSTISSAGLPARMPTVTSASGSSPLCVVYAADGTGSTLARHVTVGGTMPAGGIPTGQALGVGEIALPTDRGALVGAVPSDSGGGTAISYWLVAGGRRFALSSERVATMLGYQLSKQAVMLPAGLVDLIPEGPVLDPAAATRPVLPG
jgi:type VII secretion protein EccB